MSETKPVHAVPAKPAAPFLTADARLDRRAVLRPDAASLARLAAAEGARFLILAGLEPVPVDGFGEDGPTRIWWTASQVEADFLPPSVRGGDHGDDHGRGLIFLGVDRETGGGRFARRVPSPLQRDATQVDFRSLISRGLLSAFDASAVALARSLIAWHDTNRYCGACGQPTVLQDGGWRSKCAGCGRDGYPRVDPVVIMLVTDGERCVLAHEPRFPDRMYSCIAGYVEPGEDAAAAVSRETAEELGLEVVSVELVASQPWPFPHSLMIGCFARVKAAEIVIDPAEIDEARWFSREEAALLLKGRDPEGRWVPGAHAIANLLISRFVAD